MFDLPGWDSLGAVTRYHQWAEIIGIVVLALLVIAEVASYRYGQRKDDLTTRQQEATDNRHDEEMARLHLETAKANEAAEQLRKENLDLYEAIAPRGLDQSPQFTAPFKAFGPLPVFIGVIPEWEARRFASYLYFFFEQAGWKPAPLPSADVISDGIEIMYLLPAAADIPGQPKFDRPPLQMDGPTKRAAESLAAELKRQKIEAKTTGIPIWYADKMWPPTVPHEALIVKVGVKPLTYFSERENPELKEIRERSDRIREEALEKVGKMREQHEPSK